MTARTIHPQHQIDNVRYAADVNRVDKCLLDNCCRLCLDARQYRRLVVVGPVNTLSHLAGFTVCSCCRSFAMHLQQLPNYKSTSYTFITKVTTEMTSCQPLLSFGISDRL